MLASPERDISETLQKTLKTKNLFNLYLENYSKEKRDEFRSKFSTVGENLEKFVAFPDNPKTFFVYRKEPYSVSVPCKLIESCPDYNRTDSIDWKPGKVTMQIHRPIQVNSEADPNKLALETRDIIRKSLIGKTEVHKAE